MSTLCRYKMEKLFVFSVYFNYPLIDDEKSNSQLNKSDKNLHFFFSQNSPQINTCLFFFLSIFSINQFLVLTRTVTKYDAIFFLYSFVFFLFYKNLYHFTFIIFFSLSFLGVCVCLQFEILFQTTPNFRTKISIYYR